MKNNMKFQCCILAAIMTVIMAVWLVGSRVGRRLGIGRRYNGRFNEPIMFVRVY